MSVSRRLALLERNRPLRPDPELMAFFDSLTPAEDLRLLKLCSADGAPTRGPRDIARSMPTNELLEIIRPQLEALQLERLICRC